MDKEWKSMEALPTALSALMERRGLTETQLAAAANVSPATVNNYVHDKRGVLLNSQSRRSLRRMARALRVKPDYFVEYRVWKAHKVISWAARQGIIIEPTLLQGIVAAQYRVRELGNRAHPWELGTGQ